MATTEHVVFVDDLDGSAEDVEAVWFGLDGVLYEIDLNPAHREQLRAVLEPFMACARPLIDGPDDPDPLLEDDEEPPPRRRQRRSPSPMNPAVKRGAQVVEAARTAPMPFDPPNYPWIPFASVRRAVAAQVRRWAAAQGIPMPHQGVPRSMLEAYRRHLKVAGAVCSTPENMSEG